jgi:hypothetical protein
MRFDQTEFHNVPGRAARVLGAMQCLEELVSNQVPIGGIAAEPLACMLSLLNEELEPLLPLERGRRRPAPINDAEPS